MRIGLVLPSLPGYSEVFFKNKLRVLEASEGFRAVVFVDTPPLEPRELPPTVRWRALACTPGPFARLGSYARALGRLLGAPRRALRLAALNQRSGLSLRQNLASLYLSSHILGEDLDWVHFGFATMALGRENLARAMGARTAVSFRGFDVTIYPLKHPGCFRRLWESVDRVHTISDDLAAAARTLGMHAETDVRKITPAIEVATFHMPPKPPHDGPKQLVLVARLHWKKGTHDVVEALSSLAKEGFEFTLTLVGDGPERERIAYAAVELGIASRLRFTGSIPQTRVCEILRDADMFLQYSLAEGFCNAALEAQAAGKLCVVSDAHGLAENVGDGTAGWVVPRGRPDLLAATIREVFSLPPEVQREKQRFAQDRVAETFHLDRHRDQWQRFYGEASPG